MAKGERHRSPFAAGETPMTTMSNGASYEEWKASRTEQDNLLYEKYGKPLENERAGEFVAISDGGQIIFGDSDLFVMKRANREFGPGRYALRRIGADYEVLILDVRR
jgi:hypothetical protein